MVFVRKKLIKNKEYYYLVQNYNYLDKIKQKNLKYLGSKPPSKDELEDFKLEFTNKKIQQIIRNDLQFEAYKVENSFLNKADLLKEKFHNNLNKLSVVGRKQLINRFKTGYTYHSCSIEGNTLSKAQVDLIINKQESVQGKKLIELQEVINHKEAIEYMIFENDDLTQDFIKRLHSVLTKGIAKLKKKDSLDYDPDFLEGKYRIDQRFIQGADFVPVNPELIKIEIDDLLKFYNKHKYTIHPLELASEFHMRFVVIHPFADGNGRMARLLMNFILYRSNYPMIDIPVENREEYINALASNDSSVLTSFIYKELKSYIEKIF